MDYLDFELEIGAGSGREYPVTVIRSPAGEARATMRFPFDTLALENRLQALQIALLRASGAGEPRRRILRTDEQAVQEFGRALFDALLTGEVRNRYAVSRDKVAGEGKGLRLKLRIQPPELAKLPWEFLYDPGQEEYVCLSRQTPLVRYLEIPRASQAITINPPLRILGMVASPKDLPALDTERERQRVEAALEDLVASGLVELVWLPGQTWRDLRQAMWAGPWHIFHLIGHGSFDPTTDEGLVALADDAGRTHLLSATLLGRLLDDHYALRLVVLNACEGAQGSARDLFSSTAATLVRRGVPAVLAMQFEISDQAAIELSHTFYQAVASGMPVDAAVSEARTAVSIALDGTLEWGTPVLYMRAPDGVLFNVQAPPASQPPPPVVAERPGRPPPARPAGRPSGQAEPPAAAPPDLRLELRPRRQAGRPGAFQVVLANPGDQAVTARLRLGDGAEAIRHAFGPGPAAPDSRAAGPTEAREVSVEVGPRREVEIPLTLSGPLRLTGAPRRYRFRVEAVVAGRPGPPLSAEGELEQPPASRLLVAVPLLVALVGALAFLAPRLGGVEVTSPTPTPARVVPTAAPTPAPTALSTAAATAAPTAAPAATAVAPTAPPTPAAAALVHTLTQHAGPVRDVAFSPNGEIAASAAADGKVRLWRASDGQLLRTLEGHTADVYSVAFSGNGELLASGSLDRTARIWRVSDGAMLHSLAHESYVASVTFARDGRTLVSGDGNGWVTRWQVSDGGWGGVAGADAPVESIAFTPDGQMLAVGAQDGLLRMFTSELSWPRVWTAHAGRIESIAFAPDGQTLASGGHDGKVNLWRVGDGTLVRALATLTDPVTTVAFSPDGQLLAIGSHGRDAQVRRVGDGGLLHTLTGHTDGILGVAFARAFAGDRRLLLATASADGTVRLWRLP